MLTQTSSSPSSNGEGLLYTEEIPKEENIPNKREQYRQFQHWLNETYNLGVKENGKFNFLFKKHLIRAMECEIGADFDDNWGNKSKILFTPLGIDKENKNNQIKILQAALACRGYWSKDFDGNFDESLKEQVSKFQKDNNLAWDGNVGWTTMSMIFGRKQVEGEHESCGT